MKKTTRTLKLCILSLTTTSILNAQSIVFDFAGSTPGGNFDPADDSGVLVYTGIAPGLDLRVTIVGGDYASSALGNNGRFGTNNEFGQINLAANASTQFQFQLVDTGTTDTAARDFNFSFYDIDTNNNSDTSLQIFEGLRLVSTNGSQVTNAGAGLSEDPSTGILSATQFGPVPNPEVLSGLTQDQIDVSVTYNFTNTDTFVIEFENTNSATGSRNFQFSGANVVPEPTSAALLGLGGIALMLRRKRA